MHNEILQITNQRFQLTTLAIGAAGSIAAWVTSSVTQTVPTPAAATPVEQLAPMATLLAFLIIFGLFWYQGRLWITLRWLSSYLLVQGPGWELHWMCFRHNKKAASRRKDDPFHAYSWGVLHMFLLLMAAVFVYVLMLESHFLAHVRGTDWQPWNALAYLNEHGVWWWGAVMSTGIVLGVVMSRMTRKLEEAGRDHRMIEDWKSALDEAVRLSRAGRRGFA